MSRQRGPDRPSLRPGADRAASGKALLLLLILPPALAGSGCDRKNHGAGPRPADPVPGERLHPAGELRLTSSGREPRLLLRYRLLAGDRQAYRTAVHLHHRSGDREAKLSAILVWERKVIATRDDRAEVKIQVRRVQQTRPVALRDGLKQRLERLDLALTLDRRGRVHLDPGRPPPAQWLTRSLGRLTAPLPRDAVGEGATWERYEPVDLTLPRTRTPVRLGVRATYRLTFKKKRGEERVAVITARLKLTARGAGKEPGPRLTGGGHGKAELRLDLRSGLVTHCTSEVTLELELTQHLRRRRLKQTLRAQTSAVKLRPRPKPDKGKPGAR